MCYLLLKLPLAVLRKSFNNVLFFDIILNFGFRYYYYEPVQSYVDPRRPFASPTPAPVATPSAYRRRPVPTSHQEERIAHFYATDVGDEVYNTMAYRSSPQIPQQRPVTARVVPSATLQQPTSRRHPVTVRTPR